MKQLQGRLRRNTLALLISNAGSAILSFGLSVIIGRVLGQTGLGVYASTLAWIFPLSLITEFGIGTLITRDVAQSPENSHAYLRASIIARLMMGSVLMIMIWLLAPLLSDDTLVQVGLRIASPMIIILPFYSSFTAIFRAKQVMMPIALLNLGMLIVQVTWTAIAVWLGSDILILLFINTVTSALQLIAAWAVYRRQFYHPTKHIIELEHLLRRASPFAVAAILAAIQSRIIIILLEQFTTIDAVGSYSAAFRFIEAGRLLPHAFFDALFPLLAGLATIRADLNHMFRRMLLGLTGFGVLFASVITVVATPLITLTYGTAFIDTSEILVILAWGLLPMLLKSGRTLYWYALGQEGYVNLITGVVIVLQVLLSLWLIPSYGVIGAAYVVIITEISACILLFAKRA
ncbi:MAG: flippase [Chloroflexota bacterium]